MQSNAATEETRNSSTSRKDEMCRKWFTGSCVRKWCPYAHKIIPSNLTCNLWLLAKCTRKQCPFVHERQASSTPS
ncbi:hypothetical protein DFH29DRAFT_923349 [Suillus ampliporus]|nr:hypothetical protein DFH29DRAFT_923349 [Suillus ampliporus]